MTSPNIATTINGQAFGANGSMMIAFEPGATAALVDAFIRAITYRSLSNDPPAIVAIDYVFDDGDLSGPLSTTGTANVAITAQNDPPALAGDLSATIDEGSSYALTALDLGFADADDIADDRSATVNEGGFVVVSVGDIAQKVIVGIGIVGMA